ncbi:uncharacterized [Tachysurus ichikawai]
MFSQVSVFSVRCCLDASLLKHKRFAFWKYSEPKERLSPDWLLGWNAACAREDRNKFGKTRIYDLPYYPQCNYKRANEGACNDG